MRNVLIAVLLTISAACSSAVATGKANPEDQRNTITADEIASTRRAGWYAYEVINQLRPNMLKPHNAIGLDSRDPIYADVYLNETYHGDIESLKSFPLDGITSIQYMSPFDAQSRFGKDMPGGAILIRTH